MIYDQRKRGRLGVPCFRRWFATKRNSAKPLRKHAGFAKSACFRGDQLWPTILQMSRESMAPVPIQANLWLPKPHKFHHRIHPQDNVFCPGLTGFRLTCFRGPAQFCKRRDPIGEGAAKAWHSVCYFRHTRANEWRNIPKAYRKDSSGLRRMALRAGSRPPTPPMKSVSRKPMASVLASTDSRRTTVLPNPP
jgi:hypothetical protein